MQRGSGRKPYMLEFVPDHFRTQGMCNGSVTRDPYVLDHVSDRFKTQGMCIKTVEKDPWQLYYVPDHFKVKEMWDWCMSEGNKKRQKNCGSNMLMWTGEGIR